MYKLQGGMAMVEGLRGRGRRQVRGSIRPVRPLQKVKHGHLLQVSISVDCIHTYYEAKEAMVCAGAHRKETARKTDRERERAATFIAIDEEIVVDIWTCSRAQKSNTHTQGLCEQKEIELAICRTLFLSHTQTHTVRHTKIIRIYATCSQ